MLGWRWVPLWPLCLLVVGGLPVSAAPPASLERSFQQDVRPLLAKYCFDCHGSNEPKGNVRLDRLSVDFVNGDPADLETWHDVLENLHRGEMPPKNQPRPTAKQHGLIVDWLNRAFVEARLQRESTGGQVVMRRLTTYEFQNTLEDLLGLQLDYAKNLLPEVPSRDGFLNNGAVLNTSSQHVREYWNAARFALSKAIVVGERPTVYQVHADEFSPFGGRGGGKGGGQGGGTETRLLPDTALMARIPGLPEEGRFRIRVNLTASGPKTAMLVWFKLSANNQTSIIVAKPEIPPGPGPQNVDIEGNIQDFPVLVQFAERGRGVVPYLCLSNIGDIHFFRGGNGSVYPSASSAARVQRVLEDEQAARQTPVLHIHSVEFEAPFVPDWPPAYHRQILFASPHASDESKYVPEVLERFMQRAFRRPVTPQEVQKYAALFAKLRPKFDTLEETMRETLAAVLVSPDFLYLVEPRDPKTPRAQLTQFEWASRLSYFLWNSMPDAELLDLARQGRLNDPTVRKQQLERLLKDARAWRFVESFTDQWWNLPMLDKVAVNPEFHPGFDEDLKADMRRESQLFFAEFLQRNLDCRKLVDADFTFLNNRLARHYQIRNSDGTPLGSAFQRVALRPEDHRGNGILSHGSTMLLNSDGVESHPIKRAVWVRNAIFDDPPPEPPADVPELKTDDRGASSLTLKERIEQHRSSDSCAHCHSRVDPWGIALEQYDALGRFRVSYAPLAATAGKAANNEENEPQDRKPKKKAAAQRAAGQRTAPGTDPPVDASVELPDGHKINGADELKTYILTHGQERFARAIVRKMLAYALGRSLEVTDQPLVEDLTRSFGRDGYRLQSLLLAIVQSEPFNTK